MTTPRSCQHCGNELPADSHANRKYHPECFDSVRRARQTVSAPAAGEATTRRCRNKNCIERFVPVNAQNWYHEAACSKSPDLWTEEEILREEGNLAPGASAQAIAKVAFGQKNTALRKNAQLTSLRDYLAYEVSSFYDENPEFRFPTTPVVPRDTGPKGEREVIVQLSDWQVGKWENGVGVEATLARVRDAERAAVAIVERTRAAGHPVNRVHVTFGGDMIEGCFIYKGQNVSGLDRTGNTHRLVQQIRTVAHRMAEFVAVMAEVVEDVQVQVVGGNHGRTNGPNDFADPEDNFDVMAAWWAEDLTKALPGVTWNISEDWWHGFYSLGQYVVMFHGDQWRGPFARLEKLLPSWVVADVFEEKPKLVLTHHRHEGAEANVSGMRVIQNGTLDGGSNWYMKSYGGSSTPQQNVIVMAPDYTPEAVWPVNFEATR
jgi:hypothetical protein